MSVVMNLIPEDEIEGIWHLASPLLDRALARAHGETNLEHLYNDLTNGDRKLIMISEGSETLAAIVISMNYYPEKKVCQVSYAGGKDMDKWHSQVLSTVERIAKEAGATSVIIHGRRGWVRKLKNLGYDEYSTLIGKEL